MKRIDVGQAVNTLANIGVIAGIVFLAIEIRQNQALLDEGNRISQRTLEISSLNRFSEFRAQLAGDEQLAEIWIKGVADKELSEVESLRFTQHCRNFFWATGVMAKHFSEAGVTDVDTWVSVISAQLSDSNRLRDCWDGLAQRNMRAFSSDAFVDAVERSIPPKTDDE